MKKRLFAWLLAVVLALSMGAAPTPGQTPGAEQAEQGADVSVQTPDTAETAGDDTPADEPGEDDGTGEGSEDAGPVDENGEDGENDAPAGEEGETGENDALAGEPGEGGEDDAPAGGDSEDDGANEPDGSDNEDDGPADTDSEPGGDAGPVDEDSGDGGEDVPAPINNAPSNDEPQTTADGVVNVTLVDDEGYVTWVSDSNGSHSDGPLTSFSYVLNQGDKLRLSAKVCALDVKGGHVTRKDYDLDQANGALSVTYLVEPDGTGDMTVTTRADDQAPTSIKIVYEGAVEKINTSENVYVLPGHSFTVKPMNDDDYTISVEGGISSVFTFESGGKECYMVHVSEDAISVKVTVTAGLTGTKLELTGIPEAAETTDIYNRSGEIGRDYVESGGTMENGKGWFTLKNGYAVGSGVTGGSVWLWTVGYDEAPGDIYSCYIVDAAGNTVTVPIVEAQPYRWVDVKVDNDVGGDCNVRNVLPVGYSDYGGSEDWEYPFVVLDELTATLGSGYELEAVSGCTLGWENDMYGKLTYRVFPDAAGDTEVELRVIQAGQQEPVLKVVTDADAGVQTAEAAESLLEAAIDTLAKGGVPAGMSQDTAEKLRAALAEADAVTVPELSAVLRVKQGDRTAVPGADAVYEIGIVLRVNGTEVGSLTELAQSISIGLPLPQQLAGRIVYVVRSHEGKQEKLASTVQDGVIRFATDRFSEFAIMSGNDLADAAVDPIPDQTRTGAAVTPKVRVTITGPTGEETLREGTDYELVYKDNVNAGTATVTVKGIGDFAGTSTTVTFRIVEARAAAVTSVPATGDETPLALYAGLLALSAGGLAAVLLRRKKQR